MPEIQKHVCSRDVTYDQIVWKTMCERIDQQRNAQLSLQEDVT